MMFIVIIALVGSCLGAPSAVPLSDEKKGENIKADVLGVYTYPPIGSDSSVENSLYDINCPPYHVPNLDGSCSVPDITQNVFVYGTPIEEREKKRPLPKIPRPKIAYNVVVIRSKDSDEEDKPIIVPPPREKTVVLVLKKEKDGPRKVIQVESDNEDPEVFFVDYKDGQNFNLPGGIDLQTALQYVSSEEGEESSTGQSEQSKGSFLPRSTGDSQIDEQPKPNHTYFPVATSSPKTQPKSRNSYAPRTSSYTPGELKPSKTKITRRYPLPRQRLSELSPLDSEETYTIPPQSPTTTIPPFRPSMQMGAVNESPAAWKTKKAYDIDEHQTLFKRIIENKIKNVKASGYYRLPTLFVGT